jgi:hypothetical protein
MRKLFIVFLFLLFCSSVAVASDAKLAWDAVTPAPTGYKVYYGTVSGTYTSNFDAGANINTIVTGFTPTVKYYFVIRAYNAAGESGNSNEVHNFLVTNVTASAVTATTATITWTTDEASDTQVAYGTTTAYGATTTLVSSLATSHTAALTGLTQGTLYHYRVMSKDSSGNGTLVNDYTFTTGTLSAPPVNFRIVP